MNEYRERHKIAVWALEDAKAKAEKYSLPSKTILFKKIDKNGKVSVGYKHFGQDNFRLIKRSDVESMGVNVNSLPEYTNFSDVYRRLLQAANSYFYQARSDALGELKRAKHEMLAPYYAMRRAIYDEYMLSEEWARKRQHVFAAQGSDCIDCGNSATDIHHLHYETLGDECPENDLVPLCRDCHSKRHGLEVIEP